MSEPVGESSEDSAPLALIEEEEGPEPRPVGSLQTLGKARRKAPLERAEGTQPC